MKTATNLRGTLASALKPIPKVSVSAWADKHRMLPSDSPEPGRWKTARAPYTREIMDAFTDNNVRRVAVKSSSQIGKSEVINNIIGRYVALDPCTILLIQPTLEMAQDFSKARLSKMIADTKSLTPLFYQKTRDANQTILSKFFKGGRLVLGGANSPAGLASRPIRILLCDEVDRFPASAGGEGDPVDLAAKRTSNYFNAKVGLFSTPTTMGASRIDVEYLNGTQEEWHHRCPNCGEWHTLDYQQMVSDYSEEPLIVRSVKWRCPDCGFEFGEQEMKSAAQGYVAQNPDALANGIRSFWLNAFSSPWLSWQDIMREWLEAQGDATREAVVMNTRFGLSYEVRGEYSDETEFMHRREDYYMPDEVKLLTCAADVQGNRLEWLICGWGRGFECWCIERNIVSGTPNNPDVWRALDAVIGQRRGDKKIARTFIDSGYATAHVYEYCRSRRDIFPIKGKGGPGIPLLWKTTYPAPGVVLMNLGVDDGKTEIFNRLSATEGSAQIHFNKSFDETFFKQLIAERRVIRRSGGVPYASWEPVTAHARNEALDLMVYNLAAARSVVTNDNYWQDTPIKKAAPARVTCREVDIW